MYGGKVRERLIPNIKSTVKPETNGAAAANGTNGIKSEIKTEKGYL